MPMGSRGIPSTRPGAGRAYGGDLGSGSWLIGANAVKGLVSRRRGVPDDGVGAIAGNTGGHCRFGVKGQWMQGHGQPKLYIMMLFLQPVVACGKCS